MSRDFIVVQHGKMRRNDKATSRSREAVLTSSLDLALAYPPKLPQLEPCSDDWLNYKKRYYHSEAVADWNSSEFCSGYGASLAVTESQELNFIMYQIHITDFWIGLHRKGNKFFWVNGELFDTNLFAVNITNDGDSVHRDAAFVSSRRCSSLRNCLCTIGQFNPKMRS
ncbi:LOW QUALITY PROTEIN: C-type lectin domain family 2 member L-like [Cariama cristata]